MRLIDADALKEDINVYFADSYRLIDTIVERIEAMPTIERKTGEWLTSDDLYETGICSCCKQDSQEPISYAVTNFHYCPNCGARMEDEE